MKQIAHAYYFWVMNTATSSNLWSCQDLFRQAIKVKNESVHNFHHPILHAITAPTNTDTEWDLVWIFINADLFPFVPLFFPVTHPTPTAKIFFFKGQLWHHELHPLGNLYALWHLSHLHLKKSPSLSLDQNINLGQAWILEEN